MKRPGIECSALIVMSAVATGCDKPLQTALAPTPQKVRLERRLYSGAPPVIPHEPLGAACTACHTDSGREVPGIGIAPANPHQGTDNAAATINCRQCHVFSNTDDRFAETTFTGYLPSSVRGDRLYAGAPPVVPHRLFMRENCAACHTGPAARPEIVCTHPERTNCRQCHMQQAVDFVLPSGLESSVTEPIAGKPQALARGTVGA